VAKQKFLRKKRMMVYKFIQKYAQLPFLEDKVTLKTLSQIIQKLAQNKDKREKSATKDLDKIKKYKKKYEKFLKKNQN
jgi:hypothetical protein